MDWLLSKPLNDWSCQDTDLYSTEGNIWMAVYGSSRVSKSSNLPIVNV